MKRSSNILLFVFLCAFVPFSSFAATTEFRVLLDTDNNASTGCSVTTPSGPFAGVEQVLITTVDSNASGASVTSVARQVCSSGAFGDPIPVAAPAPWGVGFDGGSGNSLVETVLPLDTLGTPTPEPIRVGFLVSTGASVDAVTQAPNSNPLLWPASMDNPRRHATNPGALPQQIVLDGNGQDWGGIGPFVPGASGGPSTPKFINIYLFADTTDLWFRFDTKLGSGTAPVANNDTYSVRQGKALNVNAPGVLANDSDPNNAPLTPSVVSNPQHGTLALDSSGAFIYINNGSSSPVDTFTYKDSNGTQTSNTANVTINVTPDHKPNGVPDTYNVPHAGTLTVPAAGVLTNDTDLDGDHLSAVLVNGPQHGTLTLTSGGGFTYTHDGSNTLQDTFTYRADDGVLQSSATLVTITIGPDAPPLAVADSYTVAEGGTLGVPVPGLFANDSDPDTPQNQWTVQVVTGPAHGNLTIGSGGSFTYVHDGSETTSDSFTYAINDGIQTGNTVTVSITVTPVNDPPVAVADSYPTLIEDTPFSANAASGVLANDTDADTPHSSLTAILVSGPAHASTFALNSDGSFNYTPAANYNGSDSFTYKANDGSVDSATVTVSLTIAAVNDVPTYTAGSNVTVNEDSGAYSAAWATAVSAGPADESGQALNFIVSNDNNGLFSAQPAISAGGVLTFTPAADANGSATVSVQLHDNGGTANGGVDTTTTATFTITVTAVDDAPTVLVPGAQSISEDTTFTFTGGNAITVNDIDVLAGTLTVTLGATNGTITLGSTAGLTVSGNGTSSVQATGTVAALNAGLSGTVYAPNANYSGSDTVNVTVNDNGNTGTGGPLSANASVAFTINGVNDAPVITRPATATTNEDTPFTFSGGNVISIADIDAASGSLSLTLGVSNGTLTLNGTTNLTVSGDGTNSITASGTLVDLNNALNGLIYAPGTNYNGADTLTIGINDNGNTGSGGPLTDSQSVAITINAVNDQAVVNGLVNVSYTEDGAHVPIAAGALVVDPDNANLTGALVTISGNADGPGNDVLEFDTSGTSITGNFVAGSGNLTLSGSDTLANYQQVIRSIKFYTISDTPLLAPRYIDFSANDGSGLGPVHTMQVAITASNDAPVITRPATATTNEDTPFTFNGGNVISIADPDAAAGSLSVTLGVTNGTLTLNGTTGLTVSGNGTNSISASGTLTNLNNALNGLVYAPSLDYNGGDTLNIGVNDNGNTGVGGALTDSKSVAITVNAVNDAPVAVADSYSTNEDTPLTVVVGSGVLANDTDVDTPHASLTAVLNAGPSNASSFTLNADGSFSYTPNANFAGSDSFTYHANDGSLDSNIVTVTITVNAVNDAPVITRPAAIISNEDTVFTFNGGNTISIADVDAGAGSLSLTLSVTNGVLNLSGTTGLTVSGNGTNSISASGTLTNLNNALNGMTYTPALNYNGSDTLSIGVNDNGNSGSGGPLTDAKSTSIALTAVDDAPVNSVPGTQTINEDSSLTFTGATAITVSDVDAGGADVTVTLSSANGTFTLGSTAGLTTVTGNGTGTVAATGPIATINSDLNNTVFTPTANFAGAATVTVATNDNGNTGTGGPLTTTDNITVNVTGINDAPAITRPATATTNEDTPFTFSAGNVISIADVDAAAGSLTVTLGVSNGTLTLNGTTGLTVSGDGTASITASGTLTNLNNALNGLIYAPASNYNGSDTLNIGVNDNGNTGTGGPLTDSKSVAITVNAVNDAPVAVADSYSTNEDTPLTVVAASGVLANDTDIDTPHASLTAVLNVGPSNASSFTLNSDGSFSYTPNADFNGSDSFTYHANDGSLDSNIVTVTITVSAVNDAPVITRPATATTNEDTTFTFNGGNVISIADVDAASGSLTVTLGATNGVLNLSGTAGLTVSGNGTNSITASGTLTNLNNALNGMTYTPGANYFGGDTLSIGVNDNGNTGSGGAQTDSKSVAITVNAVNDAPVAVADSYSTNEDTPLSVAAPGVLTNDSDVDGPSMSAVLVSGPANASSFTLNANGSFSYTPNANFNGTDSFTYKANDTLLDSNTVTVTITVNAIDDPPVNSMPSTPTMPQDTVLTMSGAGAIQISDVDAGTNPVQVALTATNGTMSLNGTTGLSFTVGDGTADASMTFTGTIANINTALNGMSFTSSPGFFGTASIQIVTDDQGFTGAGGPLNDNDTLNITVQQVNQAPVNTVPGGQTVNEDTVLTFSSGNGNAISISDPDAGTNPVKVTLTVTQGTLTLSGITGLSFTVGDGTSDATMTFTGTMTNINNALQGMTYLGNLNYNGSDTLTILTDDQGNTGPGGAKTDTDTVNITITAVNDAPVAVADSGYSVFKYTATSNTSLNVSAASGVLANDTDVDTPHASLTAVLVTGPAHAQSFTLNADGSFTYVPTTNYVGSDSFSYKANDGSLDSNTVTASITVLNHAPTGGSDSFTGVGNTALEVKTVATAADSTPRVHLAGNLLTNDSDADGDTISTVSEVVSDANGTATIAADGTFTYAPAVNVTSATFTYHVTDGTDTTPVTVTITLNNKVWYVKNDVAGAGTGTSADPFKTLAAASAASASGDYIYVFTGDGTTGSMNAGITLLDNQQLIGAGSALVVGANTLTTAGTKPQIGNSGGTAVTIGNGNTIKGLTITGATSYGVNGTSKAGLTVDNVTVQNSTLSGILLASVTGTVTITNSTISNNTVAGLDINNGTATITVDNTNTITANAGQRSVSIISRPGAGNAITIGATINDSGTGILLNGNSNAAGVIAFNGTQTLNTTTNTALTVTGNAGATINFSGTLAITTTTGAAINATTGGTMNITGTANVTTGAAGTAININGVTVGAPGVTFNSVNTTGATTGVSLTSIGNGNVTINGGTISGGTTGLSLSTLGTSNTTLAGVTFTGSTTAISGSTFGTLTIGATVNVSGATALNLSTGAVSGTFANVSSTGGTNGVNLNAVTGTWAVTAGSLTGATGTTFNVTGGSGGTITWAPTIAQSNGALAVSIAGSNSNTIVFNGNVTPSGTSTGISIGTSSGTYNFNGTNAISGTGGGIAINGATGTITFSVNTSITSAAAITDFNVTSSSAAITYGGTISQTTAGGKVFNIDTYSTGTLTMNGTSLTGNTANLGGVVSTLNNITGTVVVNNLSLTSSNANFNGTLLNISGTNTGGSMTFNHLTLSATGSGHTGKGIVAVGNGTLTITATGGASSIDVSSTALDLSGQSLGAGTIATVNSSGGVNGIKLTNVGGGTLTITAGTIAGQTGAAFLVSGGAGSVSFGGTITQNTAGQRAVDIQSKTGGTFTLSGAIGSSGGSGVFLNSNTGATINITGSMTLSTGAVNAFTATGGGTVNVNTGTNNITTSTGTGILWNGVSGTSATFNNVTATSTGAGVSITSSGAENFTFNDVVVTTGKAVGVDTATGAFVFHKITATGGTDAVTVNATTGGSFTVNGTGNTAGSGGSISGCTHNGMKFTTVGTVTLKNMTLTGNGTSQTVLGSDNTCGGNLVGSDNQGCVANLYLATGTSASLTNLTVSNSGQMGINVYNVPTFTLDTSTVSTNGNESAENGLTYLNTSGASAVTVTDTNFTNNINRSIYIEERGSSATVDIKKVSAGSMLIDNTSHLGSGLAAQGILLGTDGSCATTFHADGLTVSNNVSNGIQMNIQATSSVNGYIQNCSFSKNAAGIAVTANNSATFGTSNAVPFLIQNNTGFTGNTAQAINISNASGATGAMFGKIVNNTIGTAVADSVCDASVTNCDGIDIKRFGPATFNMLVSGNTIQSFGGAGVFLDLNQTGNSNVKVASNNISNPYNNPGITSPNAVYGTFGPSVGGSVCLDISANTISAGDATLGWAWNTSGADIELYSKNSSVVSIAGYSGGNSNANVQTYIGTTANPGIATPNGGGTKVFASTASGGTWANGPASCSTP